jgi:hypothetical protein
MADGIPVDSQGAGDFVDGVASQQFHAPSVGTAVASWLDWPPRAIRARLGACLRDGAIAIAENERVKREYLIYLKAAKGLSEASLDTVAKALHHFEVSTKFRSLRKFRRSRGHPWPRS